MTKYSVCVKICGIFKGVEYNMYEEENKGFALKNIILKILFIVLLIFLIIWLFPTKGYVKNLIDGKLGTSADQTFTNNINNMKTAAISYYNNNGLPENEGDTKKVTLAEMQEENLLVDVTDSEGKTCDTKESYVEVTNNNDDYTMKVNLVCTDKEDYVISYFGAYDYCVDGVCEKKKLIENEISTETPIDQKSEIATTQSETTTENSAQCQYVKSRGGYYTNYGAWSNWTTSKINSSNTRQVQAKITKVQTGNKTVQTGTTTQSANPKKVTITNGSEKSVIYICSSKYDNAGKYTSPKKCVKTVPKYETKPIYTTTTYYRYRDRRYINNTSDYQWSSCNDTNLLNNGYTKTGKTR